MKYDTLTYDKVIKDRLRVMDIGAFEMCRLAKLPILVFNYKQDGAIEKAIAGQRIVSVACSTDVIRTVPAGLSRSALIAEISLSISSNRGPMRSSRRSPASVTYDLLVP